ncbi:MAG: hypothetical protein EOO45_29335 [Flavobacterium sp.]|nr:MAG: hypothetical protein EOO45_29335 [Flavobacterium sp.]
MKRWKRSGLLWGAILYVLTMLFFPFMSGEKFSAVKLILGIPFWIMIGLSLSYLTKDRKKSSN